MTPELTERIARAKELLQTVRHAAVATVNADGSPHNSPLFVTFGPGLTMYWSSHPSNQHSQNVARTGQVFVVLFDSMGQGGGLYLAATAHELSGHDLDVAVKVFSDRRAQLGRSSVERAHFEAPSHQRLYGATPTGVWVNMAERDAKGNIIKDNRYAIKPEQLV